jgi:hypothetical protein
MLALRLTSPSSGRIPKRAFETLKSYLADLTDTVLYPSEEGQIRSQEEIYLYLRMNLTSKDEILG